MPHAPGVRLRGADPARHGGQGADQHSATVQLPSRGYACRVPSIWAERPRFTARRCLAPVRDTSLQLAIITLIALKLTEVITWSWWWVLSPVWISAALQALLFTGLAVLFRRHVGRQMRLDRDRRVAEVRRRFAVGAEIQDASGEGLGL